ncbi:hypothetical protein RRG08_026463 [Elysia crispata]|uniref:Uncharacterized protein n=1 Tax=Elysia crispata TaxID=231223 RepID=A0AAE0Y403_9GAST|nr:hypothetical protein RRG08_026463 [Elysia crispata]
MRSSLVKSAGDGAVGRGGEREKRGGKNRLLIDHLNDSSRQQSFDIKSHEEFPVLTSCEWMISGASPFQPPTSVRDSPEQLDLTLQVS